MKFSETCWKNVISGFRKMGFSHSLEKTIFAKSLEGCQIDFLGLKWQETESCKCTPFP